MYELRAVNDNKLRQWFGGIAAALLLLAGLIGLALLGGGDAQLLSVQTGSMAPLFEPGDAILVKKAPPDTLTPGDVISYHSPEDSAIVITHRIIAIEQVAGRITSIVTQGDANAAPDEPFDPSYVAGRAEQRFANAGYAIDFMRSRAGLLAIIYLPALCVIFAELRRLTAYFRPAYRHPVSV